MSFLVSLLLPVMATVVYFNGYPERVRRGLAPADLTTASAVSRGAFAGAGALVFLGVLGVVVLVYRQRTLVPPGIEISAAAFWAVQFLIAAAIGAAVGAGTAFALLPWVRRRSSDAAPTPPLG